MREFSNRDQAGKCLPLQGHRLPLISACHIRKVGLRFKGLNTTGREENEVREKTLVPAVMHSRLSWLGSWSGPVLLIIRPLSLCQPQAGLEESPEATIRLEASCPTPPSCPDPLQKGDRHTKWGCPREDSGWSPSGLQPVYHPHVEDCVLGHVCDTLHSCMAHEIVNQMQKQKPLLCTTASS